MNDDDSELFEELLSAVQQPSPDAERAREEQAQEEASMFDDFFPHNPNDQGDEVEPNQQNFEIAARVPPTHWFGDPNCMSRLGSELQKKIYQQFIRFCEKNDGNAAKTSKSHSSYPSKMTDLVLDSFVASHTLKSVAAIAEAKGESVQSVRRYLIRTASCFIHGSTWMIGSCLSGWRAMFRTKRWEATHLIHKMRYDETPLKMKLVEFNTFLDQKAFIEPSMQNDSRFCKIFRLEWDLGFVVLDKRTGQYKLVTIRIPVPLAAIARNTAECLTAVMSETMSRVPELGIFEEEFEGISRIAVIDRFSANFKSERCLKSRNARMTSTIFSCDVHKISGCIKKGLALSDDTLSGLVGLALSMEASGCLGKMRSILQGIFAEDLVLGFDYPPSEETSVFKHRLAILDLFLPAKTMKDKKRRFVLQTFANSDLSSSEIVHWCPFGCCSTPEHSLECFQRYVVWALLPCKMKVLNRKAWTGADSAVQWAGLLHCHWHLLPRIILKMIQVIKPLSTKLDSLTAGSSAQISLEDDPDVDNMDDFNRLLQDIGLKQNTDSNGRRVSRFLKL